MEKKTSDFKLGVNCKNVLLIKYEALEQHNKWMIVSFVIGISHHIFNLWKCGESLSNWIVMHHGDIKDSYFPYLKNFCTVQIMCVYV